MVDGDGLHLFATSNGDMESLPLGEGNILRLKPEDVRNQLIALFTTCCDNVNCVIDEDPDCSGEVFHIKCDRNGSHTVYDLGSKGVTPGGNGRSTHEDRIQLKGASWRKVYDLRAAGRLSFWLGFYSRGGEIVICAWEPKNTTTDTPNSYKINVSTIAGAYKFGFMREDRNRQTESVCAFKEPFFPAFLDNWELFLTGKKCAASTVLKQKTHLQPKSKLRRNLIFFGAPGTGKSHELDKLAQANFAKSNIKRVTFYPDYTYSQFVGCFKPYRDGDSDITYKYIAGPFLETYLAAITHPREKYILIIEELNRANPAAVFGDVFQLLDRNGKENSQYTVAASKEMANCIADYFGALSKKEIGDLDSYYDDLGYDDVRKMSTETLSIPCNMYIWATMNSADQGVFPMDTAFKRRWNFRYMGINEGEDADIDGTPLSEITVPCGGRPVVWNKLRRAINGYMSREGLRINEDKLLGPFFVNPTALTEDRFANAFKDKVLLYLYEDACKTKRSKVFKKDLTMYSEICDEYDKVGEGIFGDGFDNRITRDDSTGEDTNETEE